MSNKVIRLEGLSKSYTISHLGRNGDGLRHRLEEAVRSPLKWLRSRSRRHSDGSEVFWALRDVSLEVAQGEVVGVIGRNGAGKSTLLKILSRITEPTTGRVRIRGRVSSLLEVGTGFHPELTGRENIFLNGAVLGMKGAEIRKKFDEIVAFAEVDRFLDTPVKHYSSGMHVRLAFAVAAHLDPEILLVDEVLAVGDAAFQKKCLGKMGEVASRERTVLFVSHSMSAITRLCDRAILFEGGRVTHDGPAHDVAAHYLSSGSGTSAIREWHDSSKAAGGEIVRLRAVRVRDTAGKISSVVDIRQPIAVEMEYDVLRPGYKLLPNFHFCTDEGVTAFTSFDVDPQWRMRRRPVGRYVSTVVVPGNLFNEGIISIDAGMETVAPSIFQFFERDVVAFQVVDEMGTPDSSRGDYGGRIPGAVRPLLQWSSQLKLAADNEPNRLRVEIV